GSTVPVLAAQQPFSTGNFPTKILLQDINGDGKADIILNNYFANAAQVLLNTTTPGASTFSFASTSIPSINQPGSVAVGDLNGDGKPDLAVPSQRGNGVVLMNSTGSVLSGAFGTILQAVQFTTTSETVSRNAGSFSIPVTLAMPSPVITAIPFNFGGM